jgi:hypothetical protein
MIYPLKSAARHSYKTSWLKSASTTRTLSPDNGSSAETGPPQPLATPPRVFVSYAWGDISPIALEEDRQRQEVVEWLCRVSEIPDSNGELFFVLRRRFEVSVPILTAISSDSCVLTDEICERCRLTIVEAPGFHRLSSAVAEKNHANLCPQRTPSD